VGPRRGAVVEELVDDRGEFERRWGGLRRLLLLRERPQRYEYD
jgi:hypothetical protein